MVDHVCNREQEIIAMREEISWLKKNTSIDHDILVELKTDMKYLKEAMSDMKEAVDTLTNKPIERFDKVLMAFIATVISAIVGFIIKLLG